jgi:hypothetical protein
MTDNEREARSEREMFKMAHPKFKKGGNVKHANKLKGEAKETKSIAKEEMKALKRGHAPKKIMEHEKAEHKAMGYKHGGGVKHPHPAKVTKAETHQKGYAMAETKGGRKTPHGKHSSEGDTKLKGFGMGHSVHAGHGRKVTKAKTAKDEMPTKHYARGRRVRMAGAPAGAAPGLPAGLAGALAQMGGGPGGAAPMGAMPQAGMKKGGHVAHHSAHHGHGHQIHHHHHYAKGGSIRREDGVASRGHTKGKQVKMASGGHVGSHPSRRADGIASKGHTKCKIC